MRAEVIDDRCFKLVLFGVRGETADALLRKASLARFCVGRDFGRSWPLQATTMGSM